MISFERVPDLLNFHFFEKVPSATSGRTLLQICQKVFPFCYFYLSNNFAFQFWNAILKLHFFDRVQPLFQFWKKDFSTFLLESSSPAWWGGPLISEHPCWYFSTPILNIGRPKSGPPYGVTNRYTPLCDGMVHPIMLPKSAYALNSALDLTIILNEGVAFRYTLRRMKSQIRTPQFCGVFHCRISDYEICSILSISCTQFATQ